MNKIILGVCILLSLQSFAQEEKFSCSFVKTKNHSLKSNTLNLAQIAETERYDVNYYLLDLNMTNVSTTLSGTVEIHGFARVNLDSVLFELFNTFTITDIRFNGSSVPYSRNQTAIKVPVNLLLGENFVIAIDYNGTPPTAATNPLGGSGMTNDFSPSWGNQVTWSLSEPYSAFEWFPCKQSLSDKADSVDVNITVPSTCKAGSNGILVQEINLGNGTTKFCWKHRYAIDYYLISVAVAEYVDYTIYANPVGAISPIPIQNFIYNNPATLPNFQADLDETANFVEYFSDIFGMYPFYKEKYGHCMAPLSGGMEHQTMTTQGFFGNTLTAHELAHQWWGDHVTCKSWSDIWVNEGFASYAEYLMLEKMYPGDEVQDMLDRHNNIKSQPNGSIWVQDSLNASRVFDSRLTYDKGAAFIHTLRFILNDSTKLMQGLRNYQLAHSFGVALGVDVETALEQISGLDLSDAFQQWYFGEGFPTYSAKWNVIGNDLFLKITHTASQASITPTFTNPLEIKFKRSGLSDTTIRVDIASNTENYVLQGLNNVTTLSLIDPNNWIVNNVGSILHDLALGTNGLEVLNTEVELTLSPNPATDFVTISCSKSQVYTLKVIDPKGNLVKEKVVHSGDKIDISEWSNGLFLFQFEAQNGERIIRKIVRK